jgi:hypothetical protein
MSGLSERYTTWRRSRAIQRAAAFIGSLPPRYSEIRWDQETEITNANYDLPYTDYTREVRTRNLTRVRVEAQITTEYAGRLHTASHARVIFDPVPANDIFKSVERPANEFWFNINANENVGLFNKKLRKAKRIARREIRQNQRIERRVMNRRVNESRRRSNQEFKAASRKARATP